LGQTLSQTLTNPQKTYAQVVKTQTTTETQIQNIHKVYDEKIALLDQKLSQEIR
jgi:uncharacterized protein (DUF885 family)